MCGILCKDKLIFLNITEMKRYYKVVRYSIFIFVHLLIYYSAEYSLFDEIPFRSITNPIVPTLTQQCWFFCMDLLIQKSFQNKNFIKWSKSCWPATQKTAELRGWLTVSIEPVSNSFDRHMWFVTSRYTFLFFQFFIMDLSQKMLKSLPIQSTF